MVERPGLQIGSRKTREMLLSEGIDGHIIDQFADVVKNYKPAIEPPTTTAETITAKPPEIKHMEFARFWAIRRGDLIPNPGTTPISVPVPPEQRRKAFQKLDKIEAGLGKNHDNNNNNKTEEKPIDWEERRTSFGKQNDRLVEEVDKAIAALRKPSPEEKLRQTVDEYLAMKEAIPVSDNPNDSI